MYEFGFIGTGSMGGALAQAVCAGAGADRVILANRSPEKAERLAAKLGCAVGGNEKIARAAKFILLGVKPQMLAGLLESLAPALAERTEPYVLVSMAAGASMARIAAMAGGADCPVIRLMPNTPAAVGQGVVLYDCNERVSEADRLRLTDALAPAGLVERIAERLIDAASAVSGCGPAFCDLFLEALADGAVACGLPRAAALRCAAQMMLGSAKLALDSGSHPGALKDAVCSPGGSTIQGVRALEQGGFRGTVMEAVIAAYERTLELG